MDLRVVLITGSGSGMGLAVARRLAASDVHLVIADRREQLVSAALDELRPVVHSAQGFVADVTRSAAVEDLIDSVYSTYGRLDVLVNVVGGIVGDVTTEFWNIDDEAWDGTLRVNLSSAFYSMRAAGRRMREQGFGRIVNTSSVAWAGDAARAHYSAAKAGLVALTRSASDALAPFGVTVNAVAPGRTDTGFGGRTDVELPDSPPPTGRRNQPADVAEAVAYLVGPNSGQVSGQLIVVAGGRNPAL